MPKKFHDKIKRDIRKAHPDYSEERLERATNGTMEKIAKNSKRQGSYPGPKRRVKSSTRKKTVAKKKP